MGHFDYKEGDQLTSHLNSTRGLISSNHDVSLCPAELIFLQHLQEKILVHFVTVIILR
jgi:hypothetical protein